MFIVVAVVSGIVRWRSFISLFDLIVFLGRSPVIILLGESTYSNDRSHQNRRHRSLKVFHYPFASSSLLFQRLKGEAESRAGHIISNQSASNTGWRTV